MSKLGYSSITLTDLTETLPVSLVLESNLDNYFQTKTGNLYVPNFEDGEGVIITPSLYLGQEDLEIEKHPEFVNPAHEGQIRASGFIYYKINEEKYWFNSNTGSDNKIFVDGQGRLHIQKNLNENITIEAFIEDLYNKEHNYTIELVQTSNPINFLFLEEGINQIVASIDCLNGREHFEDRNASDITMIPTLYQGDQILNYSIENGNRIFSSRFSYSWSKISGEVENSKKTQAEYIVERKEISNREYFSCTILDSLTGLTYIASQFIQDFTDTYNCSINYDKALIFTDKETEITLTTEVYFKNQKLEEDTDFNLSYNWEAIGSINNEKVELFGEENILVLNNTALPENLKNQNFIIYCSVFQTDSSGLKYQIAGNYLTISYSSDFTIKISPQTIFIPTSSNGDYLGQSSYSFNFQLVDEENNFIKKIETDFLSNQNYDDGAQVNFTEVDESKDEWNFIGNIQFDLNNINNLWEDEETFRTYEFSYRYLGKIFTEQILIVKNIVGTQGFSGYTIDWSNDFFAFAGEETIAKPGEVAETEVTAYYGSEALKIESIDIEGQYLYGNESAKNQIVNNILIQAEKINDNKVKIILTTGLAPNFTSVISPIHFNITIKDPIKNSNIAFRKTFNYTINYNGKSYSLFPSAQNIIYKANNTYEPSQIVVNALVKEVSGEPYTYEDGKIIYSFDGGIIWKFLSADKIIKDYLNLDNIIIRLYSSLASFNSTTNITETTLNENARYLLDIETIPVLTSLEGAQVGGENLIKYSRTFSLGKDRWAKDELIEILDYNFSEAQIPFLNDENTAIGTLKIYSPLIKIEENYIEEDFTLSCLIYVDDESGIKKWDEIFTKENIEGKFYPRFEINLLGYLNYTSHSNYDYSENIGTILGLETENSFECDSLLGARRWIKIWKTFSFNKELLKYKYFALEFTTSSNSKVNEEGNYIEDNFIKIKQPSLNLGNILTSWTPSSFDIDFDTIAGYNLIDSVSRREIVFNNSTEYKYSIADETILSKDNIYTLSFSDLAEKFGNEKDIYLVLENSEGPVEIISNFSTLEKSQNIIFTNFLDEGQLFFYGYNPYDESSKTEFTCFINQLKLEKGSTSTPWFFTEQQIEDILNLGLTDYKILDENGEPIIFASEKDFREYAERFNTIETEYFKEGEGKFSLLEASYENLSSSIENADEKFLGKISKGVISLNFDQTTGEPHLILSNSRSDISSANVIFSMELTSNALTFKQNGEPLATMTGYYLEINRLSSNQIKISNIIIKKTDSGVGILWED